MAVKLGMIVTVSCPWLLKSLFTFKPARSAAMSAIYSEIFEAFRSIGVAEDKALKAAEAFGKGDDDRFDRINARLDKLESEVVQLKADTAILKWMTGFVLALQVAILAKLFFR